MSEASNVLHPFIDGILVLAAFHFVSMLPCPFERLGFLYQFCYENVSPLVQIHHAKKL